jgi:hypothetical protein
MTEFEADNLFKEFITEIKEILPRAEMLFQRMTSVDNIVSSLEIECNAKQNSFDESIFEVEKHKQFIHYTSLDFFVNILNEEEIRCYSASSMNDPGELFSFLNRINEKFNMEYIQKLKQSLYIFSMCKYNEVEKDDFNLWRLYGKDGNGVGIVFEIENESFDWEGFLIGEVRYGTNLSTDSLIKKLIALSIKYAEKGLNVNKTLKIISFLISLNKHEIWSMENESRIVSVLSYDPCFGNLDNICETHITKNMIGHYIDSQGNLSSYLKLKLSSKLKKEIVNSNLQNDEDSINSFNLRLKIKKVICGYRMDNKLMFNINKLTKKYIQQKKYDNIEIIPSKYLVDFNQNNQIR